MLINCCVILFILFYLFIGGACLKPGKIYKKVKPHPQANKVKWKIIKKGENLVTEKWKSNSFSYLIWFAFSAIFISILIRLLRCQLCHLKCYFFFFLAIPISCFALIYLCLAYCSFRISTSLRKKFNQIKGRGPRRRRAAGWPDLINNQKQQQQLQTKKYIFIAFYI